VTAPTPRPERPRRAERERSARDSPRPRGGWFRRVVVNGALFAVGGTIALVGLRLFAPLAAPTPLGPTSNALPVDSTAAGAMPSAVSTGAADSTTGRFTVDSLPRHAPVVVFSAPRVGPIVVPPPLRETPRPRPRPLLLPLSPMERARAGGSVRVNVTAYCLKGLTRRDHMVRRGIVAADPRYFPLGRYIDLTIGFGYHGRYLVDDTGKDIQGLRLDVWTESCSEARRFGRRFGSATLVPR
jgi:3D (Asp-Asp-Asp) domain-containing protein